MSDSQISVKTLSVRERLEQRRAAIEAGLVRPVDIASIAVFRIAFGVLLLIEVFRYFYYDWIRIYYIDPPMHFSYIGFDWVKPLPGNGMYLLFGLLGILAVCIALGFYYRVSIVLFIGAFAY